MSDYWDIDDAACPRCGHAPTRYADCHEPYCDGGWIDMHEADDPLWYSPGEEEPCPECRGFGILRWCPACGHDLNLTALAEVEDGEV